MKTVKKNKKRKKKKLIPTAIKVAIALDVLSAAAVIAKHLYQSRNDIIIK